ncbi:MAG: chemotaxis protein CheB [Blastocatellia bacterium]|nr:MAG: chemotaxis protein CheB [Blastocatellia bacterium]
MAEAHESYGHDIVLIGASAGGVEALQTLIGRLPADLPAAVFVVLHMPAQRPSYLAQIFSRTAKLRVKEAYDREPIQKGSVYLAIPDHHLLVDRSYVRVVRGPKENLHRPAIDTLFRSAARSFGPRCIGVVLTGARDDGTVGMMAIKSRGGIALIQDPADALYPSMPLSVLQNVQVDYQVPLEELPSLIGRLALTKAKQEGEFPVSDALNTEANLVEQEMGSKEMISSVQKLGSVSTLTCPECHGALWEIHDPNVLRFRCHVGHAYSAESLVSGQDSSLELALWSALRALEEKLLLAQRAIRRAKDKNFENAAALLQERAAEAERQADIIRQVLLNDREPLAETNLAPE